MDKKDDIKALAALLQDPKKNLKDPNVWDSSTRKTEDKDTKDIGKNLKKLADDMKKIRDMSSPALKEFRDNQKGTLTVLTKIEKTLATSAKESASAKKDEKGKDKEEKDKKEKETTGGDVIPELLKSGSLGAIAGGAVGAAGLAVTKSQPEEVSYIKDSKQREENAKKIEEERAIRKRIQEEDDAKVKGLAQVLNEPEEERKRKMREAAETGPSRAIMEEQQAQANQAADYKAAGETMAEAGYTTVSDRRALKPGAKEMQPADYEQAQQAQAAREAASRGLRQRKGKAETVPIPPRPDTVEPVAENESSSSTGVKATREDKEIKRMKERAKKVRDAAIALGLDPNKATGIFEANELTKIIVDGKEYDLTDKLSAEQRKNVDAVRSLKGAGAAESSGSTAVPVSNNTEPVAAKPVSKKSYDEIYAEQLEHEKGFGTEEQQKMRAERAARLKYRAQQDSDSVKEEAPIAQKTKQEVAPVAAKPESNVQPVAAKPSTKKSYDEIYAEQLEYEKGFGTEEQQKIRAARAARLKYRAQESNVEAERSANPDVGAMSAENKELGRESSKPSTQPVVIQNNNSSSTQSFVPVTAQPRVDSSFRRVQEKNAAY